MLLAVQKNFFHILRIQHLLKNQLRANIDGHSEVFTVAVKSTTNNDDALGSLAWEEYT